MSSLTPNMGLTVWSTNDYFNHVTFQANWTAVDIHDHSTGKGVQIGNGGIAPLSIATNQIQDGAVTASKLVSNAITGDRMQDGTLPASKIVPSSINVSQIGQLPQARVFSSSAITIPNSALTALSFTNAPLNTPTSIWAAGQPTRLVAPSAGVYFLQAIVGWAAAGGTLRRLVFRRNASEYIIMSDTTPAMLWQNMSGMFYLAANDYVELMAYQDSGSSLNLTVTAGSDAPEARFCWLSN